MGLFESLEIPIIQEPLLGATTPEMVLAVSRAGGLGSLAGGGLAPDALQSAIAGLKAATDRPFAVNLLMVERASPSADEVERVIETLRPWYESRGLEVPVARNDFTLNYDHQFEALVRAAPPAASFTFSILTRDQVTALHAQGTTVIGTATTVAEASAWDAVGADAICAQGSEAGGQRGAFLAPSDDSLIGTLALVAAIRTAVRLPVIAAGGIVDGRGVAAVLALGAAAAQMGAAFLVDDLAPTNPVWNGRIGARDVPTRPTHPPRAGGAATDDPEVLSLWASSGEAGALVEQWWAEAKDAAWALVKRTGG